MKLQGQRDPRDAHLEDKEPFAWDDRVPLDDFTLDKILITLSPEQWFPTARIDIPLWCV